MERTLETALVLVLRDAAPFDAVIADHFPDMVGKRIPFHVTLLSPFAPPDELTDTVRGDLRDFFAGRPPLALALTRIETFPAVVYAVPEPVAPLLATMSALYALYPDLPPYGGEFDEVIPHATLAELPVDQVQRVKRDVERRLSAHLPREFDVQAATLLEEVEPDLWREREQFPLLG